MENYIMANAVIMPRQGQSVESCIITEWKKNVGDKVAKGDVLFSYETDKSAFDEVSEVEGTMLKILYENGDDVTCLETVCIIGAEGEDISSLMPVKEEKTAPAAETKTEEIKSEATVAAVAAVGTESTDGRIRISPRARALVEKTYADLSRVIPTGPSGRIIERDIQLALDNGFTVSPENSEKLLRGEKLAETAPADISASSVAAPSVASPAVAAPSVAPSVQEAAYTDEKLSGIRKVISKSMHTSLTELAQLTLNTSFDASALVALRAQVKANGEALGLANITLNDMIVFAVSRTLSKYKALNANLINGDTMRYFSGVHVGVAVDTERGLMVPTVFDCQKLTLSEVARTTKALISDCQAGKANPDVLRGTSFTVSNIGPTGIESFTPVINPPQTAILGVCSLTKRVKEVNGAPVFYPCIPLSLTIDHRAVDGAPAAKFLSELVRNLENFSLLLTK